jgi:hypothetical protein
MISRQTIAFGTYGIFAVLALATIDDSRLLLLTLAVLALFAFKTYAAGKLNP